MEELGTSGENSGLGGCQLKGLGVFFKALVQAVLIFGLERWAMTLRMGRSLGSFQHMVARRITGRQTKQREEKG